MGNESECCDHSNKVNQMYKTLYGNGSPENSLVVKTDRIDKAMKRVEKAAYAIILGLVMMLFSRIASHVHFGPMQSQSEGAE